MCDGAKNFCVVVSTKNMIHALLHRTFALIMLERLPTDRDRHLLSIDHGDHQLTSNNTINAHPREREKRNSEPISTDHRNKTRNKNTDGLIEGKIVREGFEYRGNL